MSDTFGYKEVFDAEFYSCRLGVAKPDAAYFLAILNDIQILRIARCMLLGLRPSVILEGHLTDCPPRRLFGRTHLRFGAG